MKCKKCGNELREDAKFCDKCGSLVEMEDEVTTAKDEVTEPKDENIETEENEIEINEEKIIAETTSKTTKKCKKCGSELDKDTRFCGKCGAPVDSEENDNTTNSKMNKKNAVIGVLSKHADLGKDMKNAVSGVLSNHADLGKDIKKAASDTLSNHPDLGKGIKKAASDTLSNHADLGKNMKNAASNAFSNHKDSRTNIENEVSNELPNLERKQKEKTGLTGSYEKMNKKCKGKLPLYLLVVFVLIMSMAAIGSGSDSDTDSSSKSNTPSATTESDETTKSDKVTEMTAAEIKENTESIDVAYDGETKAGTVLDEKNDGIEVTATLNDDTEKVVTDWKVETAKTLEKGGTTKVRIIYGDNKKILEVECSTKFTAAEKKANFIAECQTYTYKKLAQEPDAMLYKSIKVSGEVIQVMNNDDDSTGYRVAMNGNYDTVVYVEYDKTLEKRIIEDEYVSFYGYCADLLSYTTVMGAEQSIPAVVAVYIKR